jgi:hypothetical protein
MLSSLSRFKTLGFQGVEYIGFMSLGGILGVEKFWNRKGVEKKQFLVCEYRWSEWLEWSRQFVREAGLATLEGCNEFEAVSVDWKFWAW